jgi:hypothetical protein
MRVCAVNGTATSWGPVSAAEPRVRASSTMDLPSGVESASDERAAAPTRSSSATPDNGTNSVARRLP